MAPAVPCRLVPCQLVLQEETYTAETEASKGLEHL